MNEDLITIDDIFIKYDSSLFGGNKGMLIKQLSELTESSPQFNSTMSVLLYFNSLSWDEASYPFIKFKKVALRKYVSSNTKLSIKKRVLTFKKKIQKAKLKTHVH